MLSCHHGGQAQHIWYTTATVPSKVQRKITKWKHGGYTIMSMATGDRAREWAQEVLHAIDRLNAQ